MVPPSPLAIASALTCAPASSVVRCALAIRTSLPCQPPPSSASPPPCWPLASINAPPRTVRSGAVAWIWPPLVPWLAMTVPAISAAPVAFSTTLPPSIVTPVACTSPLCCKWPAKIATASPCKVPRFTARSAGACRCSRIPSRPRPVTSTDWPAANSVAPLGAWTSAALPTWTCGAMKTASPCRAITVPSTLSAPASPPVNMSRPANASASLMRKVEAVKPAVSTTAPAPTAMPEGLTTTSRPLELSVPKMALGLFPITRLMEVLPPSGWRKCVTLPPGTEKLCQLIAEWRDPGPFCVVTSSELPCCCRLA